ncbi:MAG: substrate-binding domain-containing protein [Bacilli bacterium]|nr:substrate-binding domain-containing protein [Bacilli bacterium]
MNGVIYTELFDAIHRVLHLSNCKVMIYLGTDITNIHWMDGLIILNPNVKDKDIREMVSRKIPVVVMDREADIDGVSSVVLDNSNGMTELTRRVLAKGAKTFAFVSGPDNSIESQLRFAGFQTGLAEKSVSFSEENHFHGDFTVDSGYIVAETSFVHAVELPDAIVCANDEMALGIMQAFHDYNVDYFGKTIITGFDGSANKTHLGFITCKCNHTHWGSVAAYVLTEMFSKIRSEKIKILVDVTEY